LVLARRSKHLLPVLSIFKNIPDHKLLGEEKKKEREASRLVD